MVSAAATVKKRYSKPCSRYGGMERVQNHSFLNPVINKVDIYMSLFIGRCSRVFVVPFKEFRFVASTTTSVR
jgi:hypothetical protein